MNTIEEGDDAVRRGGWIVGRSLSATIADLVVRRSAASVRSSPALRSVRRIWQEFRALSSGERAHCALIALGAALAGHLVMAAMLPTPASPTLGLTTVALLGACLVVARSAK